MLYINEWDTLGYLNFTDEAVARGVDDTYWGWGVQLTDVESDGDHDIVAATGFDQFVFLAGVPGTILLNSPMVLFINDGSGYFTKDTGAGLGGTDDSRGLAAFDYDRDGDEDLVMTNIQEPVRLFENVSTNPGNSLRVRLVQAPGGNRDGVGATVFYTAGSVTRRREMIITDSYLTGSPPEMHLGLGSATQVDQLTVRWTDGTTSLYSNIAANQDVVLSQADPDVDTDGIVDTSDCDTADGSTWSTPGPIPTLRRGSLAWTPRVRSLCLMGGAPCGGGRSIRPAISGKPSSVRILSRRSWQRLQSDLIRRFRGSRRRSQAARPGRPGSPAGSVA